MTKQQQQFLTWLKQKDPFLYDVSMKNYQLKTGAQLGSLGAFDFGKFLTSVSTAVTKVAPQVAQVKLLSTQIKRAKAGLPPIDTAAYTSVNPTYSPTSAEGQFAVDYTARGGNTSAGLMSFLPWLAGGALIFMLMTRFKKSAPQ